MGEIFKEPRKGGTTHRRTFIYLAKDIVLLSDLSRSMFQSEPASPDGLIISIILRGYRGVTGLAKGMH